MRTGDRWLRLPGSFEYARCAQCAQVYLRQRPRPDDMPRYYPSEYIRQGTGPPALIRWFRRRDLQPRVRLAARQPGHRLLDVGCATGEFLEAMRSAGWAVAGVEPAPWAADKTSARGIPVWPTTLAAAALPAGAFDVVTMWDVLEHLDEPGSGLSAVQRALRPGGRLLVTTPLLDGWEARYYGPRWPGWDAPRHLLVFDRHTLGAALSRAGFRVTAWTWISESYLITAMYAGLIAKERLPAAPAGLLWTALHARPARLLAAPVFRRLDQRAAGCWATAVAVRYDPETAGEPAAGTMAAAARHRRRETGCG
jgi:SAM-dependent methyltransferase